MFIRLSYIPIFQSYTFFDFDSYLIAIEHSLDDFYQLCFCLYLYIYIFFFLRYYNLSNFIYSIHGVWKKVNFSVGTFAFAFAQASFLYPTNWPCLKRKHRQGKVMSDVNLKHFKQYCVRRSQMVSLLEVRAPLISWKLTSCEHQISTEGTSLLCWKVPLCLYMSWIWTYFFFNLYMGRLYNHYYVLLLGNEPSHLNCWIKQLDLHTTWRTDLHQSTFNVV